MKRAELQKIIREEVEKTIIESAFKYANTEEYKKTVEAMEDVLPEQQSYMATQYAARLMMALEKLGLTIAKK